MTRSRYGSALLLCACSQDVRVAGSGLADSGGEQHASSTSATSSPDPTSGADETAAYKLDLQTYPDAGSHGDGGDGNENCPCGEAEWSYIWIASGNEHLTKVDTRTMAIEAQYLTHPLDRPASASRTAVSLDGRAAVVANRGGGLAKFWARSEDCDEATNGEAGLQTSVGAEALAWGEDDCLAWYAPFDVSTQRPVAWTARFDETTCTYSEQKVWSASGYDGAPQSFGATMCGPPVQPAAPDSEVRVYRLDGDTGVVEADLLVPGLGCVGVGPYGMAADGDGNVWIGFRDTTELIRVDGETLELEIFDGSSYGITVDSQGRPWRNGSAMGYFDRDAALWHPVGSTSGGGMAEDYRGRMWAVASTNDGLAWFDIETGETGTVPTVLGPWGVSVDIDGFVWAVGSSSSSRIHPDTFAVESIGVGGYTYSDMTGGQIVNVSCPTPPAG